MIHRQTSRTAKSSVLKKQLERSVSRIFNAKTKNKMNKDKKVQNKENTNAETAENISIKQFKDLQKQMETFKKVQEKMAEMK